jgi:TPP-dependent indolepyruvate ferredoxin oxidoreductase alpha subunit
MNENKQFEGMTKEDVMMARFINNTVAGTAGLVLGGTVAAVAGCTFLKTVGVAVLASTAASYASDTYTKTQLKKGGAPVEGSVWNPFV